MKTMNFWRTLFFSALAVTALAGCKDDDDDANEIRAAITVDGKSAVQVAVKDAGETFDVKVSSSGDWMLSYDPAEQDWLEASADSGRGGESTVTFTVKSALPEGVTSRTVKATLQTRGFVYGTEYWVPATVTVTQSENGDIGGETVVIYKETFGTDANVANTDVDKYTDWTKTGEGAANVTYAGTNVSVRKSSPNNSTSYEGASGAPLIFFGKVPATFIVQDIALTAEQTRLQLTFGGQQTIDYNNKDYTWSNENLLVALSADGQIWSTIQYTTNDGDKTNPNWVLATADFTLKAPAEKLYIRFTSPKLASNVRIDDITLQTGLGGEVVDLEAGDPIPEATLAQIAEITAAGKYKVENATVIANYAAGFLMQDATGIMLVYPGGTDAMPAAGKVVTVEGDVALYGGVLQFGNGTTITETGDAEVPAAPEAVEITAEKAAELMTSPRITYVKATGTFSMDEKYRNLTFNFETGYKGSIVAPAVSGSFDEYNGKLVDITGWFLNNSNGTTYLSLLVTDIKENESVVVVNFTSEPELFAATSPAEQTLDFVAQNLPAGTLVDFAFTGDNQDKFSVVGQTETTVTIKAAGDNTSEGTYSATLTASVDGKVLDQVDVKQAMNVVGEWTEADFSDLATSTSYGSAETKSGWKGVNVCVQSGGDKDSNPVFKSLLGTETTTKGMAINGKTTAVGVITSPVLTGGCKVLAFDYGIAFGDAKIDFKVEIKQNDAVVKTFQVKQDSPTKFEKYSFEEAVGVEGDFQIVITNNCPSNATKNADRYTIFNIKWIGDAAAN